MNNTNCLSISNLRKNAAEVIDQVVTTLQPTVIFQRSEPKAVLVEYKYFRSLEEAFLDLTDSLEAERAKNEPTRSFDEYMAKRFGKSG